jgi:hypothetical protein
MILKERQYNGEMKTDKRDEDRQMR